MLWFYYRLYLDSSDFAHLDFKIRYLSLDNSYCNIIIKHTHVSTMPVHFIMINFRNIYYVSLNI